MTISSIKRSCIHLLSESWIQTDNQHPQIYYIHTAGPKHVVGVNQSRDILVTVKQNNIERATDLRTTSYVLSVCARMVDLVKTVIVLGPYLTIVRLNPFIP